MVKKQVVESLQEEAVDQVNIEDIPTTQKLRKQQDVNQHTMQDIALMQENIMQLLEDI
tara:strand:+ start:180 stop:353 length:174 start_codon:yes stop_codon:yes gene_type:complete